MFTSAMAEPEKTYIFHIHRKDGSSLLLHPLSPPAKVVETLEKGPLEGRYGREPQVEVLTGLRDELYRQVELGVRHWLADLRFIPKFLIASGAFVAAYLFFSIVVRDPLPVIDEVVLGLAAAVASFVLLGRRDLASQRATKKRLDLRQVVDRIAFRESEFVKTVEEALHSAEGESVEQVVRRIVEPLQQGPEASPQAEGERPGRGRAVRAPAGAALQLPQAGARGARLPAAGRQARGGPPAVACARSTSRCTPSTRAASEP